MNLFSNLLMSLLFSTVVVSGASADETYQPNLATADWQKAPLVEIYNAKRVFPGILSGGQPTYDQLKQVQHSGFKTVINLRPVSETGGDAEALAVRGLGMKYVNIPIAGAAGITVENSRLLVSALAPADYPVLVHCASGNRVGALFALDAALRANLPVEGAINIGKLAGMTRLEGTVRSGIEREKLAGLSQKNAGLGAVAERSNGQLNCENAESKLVLAVNLNCE